ncbi:MAG: histidine phosphatase family protein [Acidobacteria bacterium]|nr:histidine phosphatase family protein [Acidobacteriota bacterium]MCI0623144.1 histidine phosphatase family protein [Acidobacteriota bacterium]MCI0723394.1 histidine phosphatase family protein [Acidobacteriota bacterium]
MRSFEHCRLYLIRHGSVVYRVAGSTSTETDPGLSEEGHQQAAALVQRLAQVEICNVYSSDLRRALETATAICQARYLKVHPTPELREFRASSSRTDHWDGILRLEEGWLNAAPKDGEESFPQFVDRVMATIRTIVAANWLRTALVVAHAGVNRVVLAEALGLNWAHMFRLDQDFGCLNTIDYYSDQAVIKLMNG